MTVDVGVSLHSYFAYRDAGAALRWLERAFGFVTTLEVPDGDGGIAHAELSLGGVSIMVFSDAGAGYDRPVVRGETSGHGAYLRFADASAVDELFASAVAAGASVIWEPHTSRWGNHLCRVLDPQGYERTLGTLLPGRRV